MIVCAVLPAGLEIGCGAGVLGVLGALEIGCGVGDGWDVGGPKPVFPMEHTDAKVGHVTEPPLANLYEAGMVSVPPAEGHVSHCAVQSEPAPVGQAIFTCSSVAVQL